MRRCQPGAPDCDFAEEVARQLHLGQHGQYAEPPLKYNISSADNNSRLWGFRGSTSSTNLGFQQEVQIRKAATSYMTQNQTLEYLCVLGSYRHVNTYMYMRYQKYDIPHSHEKHEMVYRYIYVICIYIHTHTPLAEMHEDIDPDPWKETPGALLPACQCSVICQPRRAVCLLLPLSWQAA